MNPQRRNEQEGIWLAFACWAAWLAFVALTARWVLS